MPWWGWFIIGLFVGGFFGVMAMALAAAAGRANAIEEARRMNAQGDGNG